MMQRTKAAMAIIMMMPTARSPDWELEDSEVVAASLATAASERLVAAIAKYD